MIAVLNYACNHLQPHTLIEKCKGNLYSLFQIIEAMKKYYLASFISE